MLHMSLSCALKWKDGRVPFVARRALEVILEVLMETLLQGAGQVRVQVHQDV